MTREKFCEVMGIDSKSGLVQDLLDTAGLDQDEAILEVVLVDDLANRRTGCGECGGADERTIGAKAVEVLRGKGVSRVGIACYGEEKDICSMIAKVDQRTAERFCNKIHKGSLRNDISSVRGWATFESE